MKIDIREGTAHIVGPATKEERAEYDWFMARRADFEEELRHLRDERAATDDAKSIAMIDDEITQLTKIIGIIALTAR